MGLDATGLGILTAAPGVGSLISSLVLASLGNFRGKGRLLLGGGIAMGLALVLFANAQGFWLVLFLLAVVGAAGNVCMVTNQALIQINCADRFLGRVMSMYMMAFGMTRLGNIPSGALVDRFGVSLVIAVQGGLFAVIALVVLALTSRIRELE